MMMSRMAGAGLALPARIQEDERPARSEPLDAIGNTAESATEAAGEFATWLASGSRDALVALGLTIGITLVLWFARFGLIHLIRRVPRDDDYSIAAILNRIVRRFRVYFMFATALVITGRIMELPSTVSTFAHVLFVITATLQAAELIQEAAISSIRRQAIRNRQDASTLSSAVNLIKWSINLVIWSIALLLILDNVGADVTALIAGLGIGGIAIGLAAQGMFRDLFSSLSIVLDKPFQVGDTVRYGDTWGDIEDIGLKTTRVRSKTGEQIIISNTNLLEMEIHNMRRMNRRRIETRFALVYQTPADVAEAVPGMVAEVVKEVQGVAFDRCGLSSVGPSGLDYELVFYSLNPDFNRSMAVRSHVLLALFRKLREEGISLAYPTQTLFLGGNSSSAKDAAAAPQELAVFEGSPETDGED